MITEIFLLFFYLYDSCFFLLIASHRCDAEKRRELREKEKRQTRGTVYYKSVMDVRMLFIVEDFAPTRSANQ